MNRVEMQQSFSRSDIRTIIKFNVLLGHSAIEIHRLLEQALADSSPSVQTVRKWVAAVKDGRHEMDDLPRSGRPESACVEANVEMVESQLLEDRRQSCEQIANQTGLCTGSVHKILTEKLGKRKVFAKWVPHLLSVEQRATRVQLCRQHLRRFRRDGEDFLNRIITCDETWVFSWDPELKRQSAEWLDEGAPRPEKARRKQGGLKVMHIVFIDIFGVILSWPVPIGTTVNGLYYLWVLKQKLRPAIRRKRPNINLQDVIFHHDNAPAHCKREVLELFDSWNWEVLPHPPYSPDLAPCDFHIFPKMKESLRGVRFESPEKIIQATKDSLAEMDRDGFQTVFDGLVHRWEKCIDCEGSYVE